MKFLFSILFALTCVPFIFGGLTRLRIQQNTRNSMSENSKKAFDKHTKSMAELINLSNQLNNVQVSSAEDKKEIEITPRRNPSLYQGDMLLTEQQASYLIDEAKIKNRSKKIK